MTDEDEKKINYYESSNENESNDNDDSNANHENENSFSNSFNHENSFVDLINSFMKTEMRTIQCKKCRIIFTFNNKLHKHIRNKCKNILWKKKTKTYNLNIGIESDEFLFIIIFSINFNQNLKTDFEFRNYQYVIIQLFLTEDVSKQSDCLNIGADFIIVDKAFFLFQFKESIRIMITEIIVRDIDADKHRTKKYVICFIYFRDMNDKKRKVRACFWREVHLMKNFKINFLIETDVLTSKKFVLNFKKNETSIKKCFVIIFIISKRHEKIINQIMNFKKIIIISSHFEFQAKIHNLNFFKKSNFLFESKKINFDLYVHIIETEISNVLIRNEQSTPFKISRNCHLDWITKMKYPNVCHATNDVMNLVIRKPKSFHRKAYFQKLLKSYLPAIEIESFESETTTRIKKKIIIHNFNFIFTKQLFKFVNDYSIIWIDQKFAILSKNEWMRISLKKSKIRISVKATIYFLKNRNRELIDQIFDDFHKKTDFNESFKKIFEIIFVLWSERLILMRSKKTE